MLPRRPKVSIQDEPVIIAIVLDMEQAYISLDDSTVKVQRVVVDFATDVVPQAIAVDWNTGLRKLKEEDERRVSEVVQDNTGSLCSDIVTDCR